MRLIYVAAQEVTHFSDAVDREGAPQLDRIIISFNSHLDHVCYPIGYENVGCSLDTATKRLLLLSSSFHGCN